MGREWGRTTTPVPPKICELFFEIIPPSMAGIWLFQAVFGNLQTTVFSLCFDHLRLYCIARDANPYVAGKGILAFGRIFIHDILVLPKGPRETTWESSGVST